MSEPLEPKLGLGPGDRTVGRGKMLDGRPIETAPRDGTSVLVWDDEGNGPFAMHWNASGENWLVSKGRMGIWEDSEGGNFTWCEHDGYGPDFWAPLPAPSCGGEVKEG